MFGRIRLRFASGTPVDIGAALEAVPFIADENPELAERCRVVLTSALWAQQRSEASHRYARTVIAQSRTSPTPEN